MIPIAQCANKTQVSSVSKTFMDAGNLVTSLVEIDALMDGGVATFGAINVARTVKNATHMINVFSAHLTLN